jgi:hypothetical protein
MRLVRDGGSAAELASVEPDDVKEHMTVDFALELVIIPVSDVDRAKDFYTQTLGFKLEVDGQANRGGRIVQVTPPGSACSIGFGTGLALDYMSFAEFSDPDGNLWLLQEIRRGGE